MYNGIGDFMRKLIISDIDGTLACQGGIVSEQNREMVRKLQNNNHYFTIASGRSTVFMAELYKELQIDIPLISSNGAFIGNPHTFETIHLDTFSDYIVKQIVAICLRNNSTFMIYTDQAIIAKNEVANAFLSRFKVVPEGMCIIEYTTAELDNNHKFLKVLVVEGDVDKYDTLKKELSRVEGVSVSQSKSDFIDVGPSNVSKGRAVQFLAEYLGVDLKDVITLGDQDNDTTMIEVAGVGVAMGDAIGSLKQAANYISKDCKEDGFAHAIQTFVFDDVK